LKTGLFDITKSVWQLWLEIAQMMCVSGGIWLWEQSSCDLDRVHLHGGASYAISVDKTCKAQLKVSQCVLPFNVTASDSHAAG